MVLTRAVAVVGPAPGNCMRCYACESSGYLLPVPHYKGDTFLYCLLCVERQHRSRHVLGYVAMALIAVAVVGWLIISRG